MRVCYCTIHHFGGSCEGCSNYIEPNLGLPDKFNPKDKWFNGYSQLMIETDDFLGRWGLK